MVTTPSRALPRDAHSMDLTLSTKRKQVKDASPSRPAKTAKLSRDHAQVDPRLAFRKSPACPADDTAHPAPNTSLLVGAMNHQPEEHNTKTLSAAVVQDVLPLQRAYLVMEQTRAKHAQAEERLKAIQRNNKDSTVLSHKWTQDVQLLNNTLQESQGHVTRLTQRAEAQLVTVIQSIIDLVSLRVKDAVKAEIKDICQHEVISRMLLLQQQVKDEVDEANDRGARQLKAYKDGIAAKVSSLALEVDDLKKSIENHVQWVAESKSENDNLKALISTVEQAYHADRRLLEQTQCDLAQVKAELVDQAEVKRVIISVASLSNQHDVVQDTVEDMKKHSTDATMTMQQQHVAFQVAVEARYREQLVSQQHHFQAMHQEAIARQEAEFSKWTKDYSLKQESLQHSLNNDFDTLRHENEAMKQKLDSLEQMARAGASSADMPTSPGIQTPKTMPDHDADDGDQSIHDAADEPLTVTGASLLKTAIRTDICTKELGLAGNEGDKNDFDLGGDVSRPPREEARASQALQHQAGAQIPLSQWRAHLHGMSVLRADHKVIVEKLKTFEAKHELCDMKRSIMQKSITELNEVFKTTLAVVHSVPQRFSPGQGSGQMLRHGNSATGQAQSHTAMRVPALPASGPQYHRGMVSSGTSAGVLHQPRRSASNPQHPPFAGSS